MHCSKLFLPLFLVLSGASCTHVKPYERETLAKPVMAPGSMMGAGEEHMYGVQEGAVGGGASAESGCGCN